MDSPPPPRPFPTIAQSFREFLDSLAGKSPQTARSYATALNRFAEHLRAQGLDPDRAATDSFAPNVLETFYTWLVRAYGRDRRFTVVSYVAGARAYFRFLFRRGLAPTTLSFEQMRDNLKEVMGRSTYKTPRVDRRLPLLVTYVNNLPLPSPSSLQARRARLALLRDKALIMTLFTTGMRREEASRLNRHDVEDGRAHQAIISGKGDKERVVFFDGPTLEAIRAYLAERNDRFIPLFLRHDKARGRPGPRGVNFRLGPRAIWAIVKRYAREVGVDVSTHDFRHVKASVMLNRGAKLSEVQDILGHASPETTKRIYAHYEVSHLREAFRRFSVSADELAQELMDEGWT